MFDSYFPVSYFFNIFTDKNIFKLVKKNFWFQLKKIKLSDCFLGNFNNKIILMQIIKSAAHFKKVFAIYSQCSQ